ncbi:MAG: PA2778 family cysteine peptidase [Gammaproteobacteria bacterium]|nr:PA2778 family cysteine peptidase [Gammaproteobacteria bacterium]
MDHRAATLRMAGVLLGIGLLGCSVTRQTEVLLLQPPGQLPATTELADTPFYPQQRYQCGPAALATVLQAQAIEVTPDELVDAVYIPALHGSLPEEMAATARRYGLLAYRLQASLDDLLTELARGNPVLVYQNLGLSWLPRWHFAVAIGYSLPDRELILRSGTTRRWHTTLASFERTWSRGDYWALVILPPGEIPASARMTEYVRAARELEQTAGSEQALPAYQAATLRWPGQSLPWLALGNSHYARSEYAAAEQAFRQASHVAAYQPEVWNNLAFALLQNSCPQRALQAARCAIDTASDDAVRFRESLEEIRHAATGADAPHCRAINCPVSSSQ